MAQRQGAGAVQRSMRCDTRALESARDLQELALRVVQNNDGQLEVIGINPPQEDSDTNASATWQPTPEHQLGPAGPGGSRSNTLGLVLLGGEPGKHESVFTESQTVFGPGRSCR